MSREEPQRPRTRTRVLALLPFLVVSVVAAVSPIAAQDVGLGFDDFKDYLRQRKFIRAVADGDTRRVAKLLRRGVNLYDNPYGDDPPMMVAVAAGHPDVVALLADAGAPVGPRGRGRSPLRLAFESGRPEVGEMLLARGAPAEGEVLLDALRRGSARWIALLTSHGARPDPRRLTDLVRNGLRAAATPEEGDELVHRALDVLFLGPGWESQGAELLFLTACRDSPAAARRLLDRGTPVDSLHPVRRITPLLDALYRDDETCAARLLAWGADAGARMERMTLLGHAVGQLRIDTARRLLQLGADADGADESGRTPLMVLADVVLFGGGMEKEANLTEAAALLLGNGARVGRRDVTGRGAPDLAAGRCHRKLFEALLQAGLEQGWSPSAELWRWAAVASERCGGLGWLAFLDALRRDLRLDLPDAVEMMTRPRQSLPPDRQAQLETLDEMRHLGQAVLAFLVEQVGAAAAALPEFRAEDFHQVSYDEVRKILASRLPAVPQTDGWGHPLEFRWNLGDSWGSRLVMIRSPGRDGRFDDAYEYSAFPFREYDQDIVWVDGQFVRWPGPFD